MTRSQAERAFRKAIEEAEARPRVAPDQVVTVAQAADSLRRRIQVEGASTSWLKTLESMQRIHLAPRFGETPIAVGRGWARSNVARHNPVVRDSDY